MTRIIKKSQGTGNQKAEVKDVAKRLGGAATAVVEKVEPIPEKKKMGRPPVKKEETPATPEKKKAVTPVKPVANLEEKRQAKASKATKVVEEEEEESMFPATITSAKTYNLVQVAGNKITVKQLEEHLATGKFPVHMFVQEGRNSDDSLAHYILCYISKTTLTFINQTVTQGEDWDKLIQIAHADILGLESFIDHKPKKDVLFPYAFYLKVPKS
jgi:hypothetical protein